MTVVGVDGLGGMGGMDVMDVGLGGAEGMMGEEWDGDGGEGASAPEDAPDWVVVHEHPVLVRASASADAKILRTVRKGARVIGLRDGGWLTLLNEPGFIMLEAGKPPRPLLRQRRASFLMIASGSCREAGRFAIQDPLTCEVGSVALKLAALGIQVSCCAQGCHSERDSTRICCAHDCPPFGAPNTTTTSSFTSTMTRTTTASTSTATTATSTATSTTPFTTTPAAGTPSLYCFSVIRSLSYEIVLLRAQYPRSLGVFGCNGWVVYSDERTRLGDHDSTVASPGPPAVFIGFWLNVDIFFRAWEKLIEAGDFRKHDWVVKVDPDAVFLPDRLRMHLRTTNYANGIRKYFKNCKTHASMRGPVEVYSRAAVDALGEDGWKCKKYIDKSKIGEDGFFQKCMGLLGVDAQEDWGLLMDEACGQDPHPCINQWTVAYHPFRNTTKYMGCLAQALTGRA